MSLNRFLLEQVARKYREQPECAVKSGSLVTNVHLGGVPGVIQQETGRLIFVDRIEEDLPDQSFTMNWDVDITYENLPNRKTVQHIVFYLPDKEKEVEVARTFHELGHCLLHWPVGKRERVTVDTGGGYLVVYSQDDEEEADAFMCLCLSSFLNREEWKLPIEEVIEQIVDRAWEKVEWCKAKGLLQSES